MALTDGTYKLGPQQGQVLLKTGRTGLGRSAGHDLTIEVTQWSAEAVANTGDPGKSSVTATLDTRSLEPREGTGGVKPLTDSDRADIKRAINSKCLRTDQHPEITFTSTQVSGNPGSFRIVGNLTIMGNTQPATVEGRVDGDRIRGSATVTQTKFGIKPYSGIGGLLKLADDVQFEFDIAIPS
jgi:polyisoprenoid-binding protein YceI